MSNDFVNNKSELRELRQRLRNNATPAEDALWKFLKGKQLAGRKFRRQFSVGYYVVDFYCNEEKLAIELDGEPHFTKEGQERDKRRTQFLNDQGIKVIRFENEDVFSRLDVVLEQIESSFNSG
ncbi:endonuclease domain-containing protein [Parvicella tangerina]|uniref:DUF559 domain-containing protein n=1 Tax=Parvicella tangerina TaxID=2829795 RepID=A0A916JNX5_9FLAO|nr:endonuclease domain-containing protein [Parvicella tangerina]CAG5083826.1 hypothetical protein CRYO30217_02302 [Parvicella tangerina]